MRMSYFVRRLFLVMLVCSSILYQQAMPAAAQTTDNQPFLYNPFYGDAVVNSWFDHQSPLDPGDGMLTHYTGDNRPGTMYSCSLEYTCYDGHEGIDFSVGLNGSNGQRILAAADGQVVFAGWDEPSNPEDGYGLLVSIRHSNGYTTSYGHLSAIIIKLGQHVTAGQEIGTVGSSGNSSGAHLHFHVRNNANRLVDPFGWTGKYPDPWAAAQNGAESWCMWAGGKYAKLCDQEATSFTPPSALSTTYLDDLASSLVRGCPSTTPDCWQASAGGWANHHWFSPTVGAWAQWSIPTTIKSGRYEIWAYLPEDHATTMQAEYSIYHADGSNLNQIVAQGEFENRAAEWVSLGTYNLNPGTSSVMIKNARLGNIGVDALRLVQVTAAPTASQPVACFKITQTTTLRRFLFDGSCSQRYQFWEWNFGDGSSSQTGPTVYHTFSTSQNYQVCLTIAAGITTCQPVVMQNPPPPATIANSISAGYQHTCVIMADGTIKCWGANQSGQLGNNTTTDSLLPVTVGGNIPNPRGLSAKGSHTCAATDGVWLQRRVWCWGSNYAGELGYDTPNSNYNALPGLSVVSAGVRQVVAGFSHTCALYTKTNGAHETACWGNNTAGQLGNGRNSTQDPPLPLSGDSSAITALAAGELHSCGATISGDVWCWGGNANGQLGDGTTITRRTPVLVSGLGNARSVASGLDFSCALTSSNKVWCWGNNSYGQLGNDDSSLPRSLVPVQVVGLPSYDVVSISAGMYHACALISNGRVYCWGHNTYGQIGNGWTTHRWRATSVVNQAEWYAVAIATGSTHSCLQTDDQEVYCWGDNYKGQLGDGSTTSSSLPVKASLE